MITEKLKNDVIFVSVDGALDYFSQDNHHRSISRLQKTKRIQKALHNKGLRCYRLNPIDGDIPYIPYFAKDVGSFDINLYGYSTYILFELYDILQRYNIDFTHIVIFQHDGFPLNFDNWTDEFLEYEYVGVSYGEHMCGGFSIRTKQFMEKIINTFTLQDYYQYFEEHGHGNEDVLLHTLIDTLPPIKLIESWGSRNITFNVFGIHDEVNFNYNKAIELLER